MRKHGTCGQDPLHGDAYIYSPAEYCNKSIDKHSFIAGHFDWCLEHEATSVDSDGTYDVYRTSKVRNDDGSEKLIPRSLKNANAVIPTRENTEAATS